VPAALSYRNGPLLTNVEVFTIFWGAAWKTAPQSGVIAQLNGFFDFILTSALIDQLGEYTVGKLKIGHGRRTGSATVATGLPRTSVTDNAIRTFVQQQITKGTAPKATANSLYFVYVAPGVRVVIRAARDAPAVSARHALVIVLRAEPLEQLDRLGIWLGALHRAIGHVHGRLP
jgi:hypothetical protein